MEIVPQPEIIIDLPIKETAKTTVKGEKKNQVLLLVFIAFITMLILAITLFAAYLQQSARNTPVNEEEEETGTTIDTATWEVTAATLDPATGFYVLTVNSSIGNIRHYPNVRGYSVSNDRKTLVISNQTGIEIYDLATDTPTRINPPFAYSGELGQEISWAPEDRYFALAVAKENNASDTHILIFQKDGTLKVDIDTAVAYTMNGNSPSVYPVQFSPTSSLVLARTYHTDSVSGSVALSPAYLSVFDINANLKDEYSVRGTAAAEDQIVYTWDSTGQFVMYAITALGETINYADEGLFTKVAI